MLENPTLLNPTKGGIMSPSPTFSAQLLGQTEKAANAILDRLLSQPGLTEHQWITLNLTVLNRGGVDADQLTEQVANALRISKAEAHARITELVTAQLLDVPDDKRAPVKLTDAGAQLHTRIRATVTQVSERLWGDLPATDLATAGRVLSTILERANAELASAQP
jgi:hypothetical protein